MRAIILAAGKGTRLRPITNTTPKSLLRVSGKTILDMQIEALERIGVFEILIAVGHMGQEVSSHIKNSSPRIAKLRTVYISEYDSKNNFHSLCVALNELLPPPNPLISQKRLIL